MSHKYCAKDNLSKAKAIAIRLLKFRARSEKEIKERLKEKRFSKDTINQAIKYLKDLKLIDDRQFARDWIATRLSKPFGLRRISFELKNKGISQKILQDELGQISIQYPEKDIVMTLAKKRITRYKNVDEAKVKQRTYRHLIYQGFSPDVVQKVISEL